MAKPVHITFGPFPILEQSHFIGGIVAWRADRVITQRASVERNNLQTTKKNAERKEQLF